MGRSERGKHGGIRRASCQNRIRADKWRGQKKAGQKKGAGPPCGPAPIGRLIPDQAAPLDRLLGTERLDVVLCRCPVVAVGGVAEGLLGGVNLAGVHERLALDEVDLGLVRAAAAVDG